MCEAESVRGELVTIGVPVRNGGRFLDQALQALRAQDYPDIEILISDNASSDCTPEICAAHAARDLRIRVLRSEEPVGYVENFNRVLDAADGAYFMWAAHDDLWEPSFVRRCVETLKVTPSAGLCCTRVTFIGSDGSAPRHWDHLYLTAPCRSTVGLSVPDRVRENIARSSVFVTYALFRTEVVRKVRFQYREYGGDNIFVLALALHTEFAMVDEPLFHYRVPDEPKSMARYMEDIDPRGGLVGPARPHTQIACEMLRVIRESPLDDATKAAAEGALFDAHAFHNHDLLGRLAQENVPGTSWSLKPDETGVAFAAKRSSQEVRTFVERTIRGEPIESAGVPEAQHVHVEADSAECANMRGESLFAAGSHAEAEALFRGIVARDAGNARALNNLGVCLWAAERREEAIESFRAALDADPANAAAVTNLRDALAARNLTDEAASDGRVPRHSRSHAVAHGSRPAPEEDAAVVEAARARRAAKDRACARSEAPVDIVFLAHNRLPYLRKTLDGLARATRYPYRLILVDNASDAVFRRWLTQSAVCFDHVILNERNEWTAGYQRGIDATTSDPFVVCDPDIVVPDLPGKCWLERLVDLHRTHPDAGLLALNLDPSNKPAKLPDVYIGEKQPLDAEIVLANVGTVMQCIKRRYFTGPYTMDWEVCEQVRRNGGLVGFAKNIVARHLGWDEDRDFPEYLVEKHRHFQETFGCNTYRMYTEDQGVLAKMGDASMDPYYGFDRPEVRDLVRKDARTILDVGCAAGNLGARLKEALGAEVWGIEPVAGVAERARGRLDRVIAVRVEDALDELPDGYFDTIVFADVLEHLSDPQDVVQRIKAKLSPRGEIVVSIPNVRHWSVLKDLIEGRWTYADAGILDRTHLRFFTQQTVIDMLAAAGFSVGEMRATMLQGCTVPDGVVQALSEAGLDTSTLREGAKHYQYIVRATPRQAAGKASIVILTWNGMDYTRKCLESIRRHTVHDHEVIVVDNGSTDGTVEYLQALAASDARYRVIANSENRGFAGGCNQGIAAASGDYVVLLNNDTVVTPGWLERMIDCAEANPGVGVVGPMSNSISGPQCLQSVSYDVETLDGLERFAAELARANAGRAATIWRVVGFCMLIRRAVIDRIGGLDLRYGRGNFEDDDYCIRAAIAGFQPAIALDSFVHHFGSKTFEAHSIDVMASMQRNWGIFKDRWGLADQHRDGEGFDLGPILRQPYDRATHYIHPEIGRSAESLLAAPDWDDTRPWQAVVAQYVRQHSEADGSVLRLYAGGDPAPVYAQISRFLEQSADNPGSCADIEVTTSLPFDAPTAVILTGGPMDARLRERYAGRCVPHDAWLKAA